MVLFFFLGKNFYMRTNPNSSVSVEITDNYFNYTLNPNTFKYGFRLDNEDLLTLDRPKYFYCETHYTVYRKTN